MRVYGLHVEWYDPQPMLTREFVMRIYGDEGQVEMYDAHSRRTFLKKSPLPPAITRNDLYVGNDIVLHSRILKIVRYADSATEEALRKTLIESTCIITPDCLKNGKLGWATTMLERANFRITKLKMVYLNHIEAEECCSALRKGPKIAKLLCSGKCVVMTMSCIDAVSALRQTCDMISKKGNDFWEFPVMAAPDEAAAIALRELAFGSSRPLSCWPTARYGPNSTCCLVRPHALMSNKLGEILSHIEATGTYEISAMGIFRLDMPTASEFMEVYEGVVPEFELSVKQLSSGPCCVLELQAQGAVPKFRETAGPWDVNFAREIRPWTLRAKFGLNSVDNAIHCTDLTDDGEAELRYFFDSLTPA